MNPVELCKWLLAWEKSPDLVTPLCFPPRQHPRAVGESGGSFHHFMEAGEPDEWPGRKRRQSRAKTEPANTQELDVHATSHLVQLQLTELILSVVRLADRCLTEASPILRAALLDLCAVLTEASAQLREDEAASTLRAHLGWLRRAEIALLRLQTGRKRPPWTEIELLTRLLAEPSLPGEALAKQRAALARLRRESLVRENFLCLRPQADPPPRPSRAAARRPSGTQADAEPMGDDGNAQAEEASGEEGEGWVRQEVSEEEQDLA